VVDAEGRRAQFVSAATREWRRLVKLGVDTEDEDFGCEFFRSRRQRGLRGVRLVISNAHLGLKARHRQGVHRRGVPARCRVHTTRIHGGTNS
jgi:transposase-like protein